MVSSSVNREIIIISIYTVLDNFCIHHRVRLTFCKSIVHMDKSGFGRFFLTIQLLHEHFILSGQVFIYLFQPKITRPLIYVARHKGIKS